jgi:GH35 family endo-1,4-beta-xylanase
MKYDSLFSRCLSVTFILFVIIFSGCKNDAPSAPVVTTGLKDINPKVLIGSNMQYGGTNEDGLIAGAGKDKFVKIANEEYQIGQALWFGNYGGWNAIGQYNFSQSNEIINWLEGNGKQSFGTFWFGNDIYWPQWFLDGTYTSQQLEDMMTDIINSQMETNSNKTKVDFWHVANEVFENDGSYRTMQWNNMGWENDASGLTGSENINTKHPIFIRKAFEKIRTKTNAKLEIRDFNIENQNPAYGWDKKHQAFYQLVKHLKNQSVPIDMVGIQGHLNIGNINWLLQDDGLRATVKKFKDLGVEVIISELDCPLTQYSTPTTWGAAAAEQQKTDVYNYAKQAILGGATQIHTWGIRDENDKGWFTFDHPLLWDNTYQKKLAYEGLKQALTETK